MNFAQTGSNLLFRSNGSIWGGKVSGGKRGKRSGTAPNRHAPRRPTDPDPGGTANPRTEHTPARERPSERWVAGGDGEGPWRDRKRGGRSAPERIHGGQYLSW